ncbi:MAG TPA: PilZ domain-containing protein [Blastocatellia bacterium]|nr:PilZ domain-containing protein [Blastocatellia bacterium]
MKSSGALNRSGDLSAARPKAGSTAKLISAHYLEIGYLLDRIDGAATYYQLLGVERAAREDEIVQAYHDAISVLHPTYHKVRAAVPDEMLAQVDAAFDKLSQAFLVLTSPRRRAEYDASLPRRRVAPLPIEINKPKRRTSGNLKRASGSLKRPTGNLKRARAEHDREARRHSAPLAIKAPVPQVVFTRPVTEATAAVNRRRAERFNLAVPAFVKGYDRQGNRWQEVTKTINVSRLGVALRLHTRLRHGSVVHITLPLPAKLRSHGFSEAGYNMYAIVRRIEPTVEGAQVVGLEFIGAQPPAGYLHKPWAVFRTQVWDGPDRRREPRVERAERVLIEYLDEDRTLLGREVAVTENLSSGGARLHVKQAPDVFEMVRVTSGNQDFSSLALVRNRFTGKDGDERLCLQFTEARWPFE